MFGAARDRGHDKSAEQVEGEATGRGGFRRLSACPSLVFPCNVGSACVMVSFFGTTGSMARSDVIEDRPPRRPIRGGAAAKLLEPTWSLHLTCGSRIMPLRASTSSPGVTLGQFLGNGFAHLPLRCKTASPAGPGHGDCTGGCSDYGVVTIPFAWFRFAASMCMSCHYQRVGSE